MVMTTDPMLCLRLTPGTQPASGDNDTDTVPLTVSWSHGPPHSDLIPGSLLIQTDND